MGDDRQQEQNGGDEAELHQKVDQADDDRAGGEHQAGEIDLLDHVLGADQGHGAGLQAGVKEHPGELADEIEEKRGLDAVGAGSGEAAEDDGAQDGEDQGLDERPGGAEDGLLVADLDIAIGEDPEELAEAPELFEIERHPAGGREDAEIGLGLTVRGGGGNGGIGGSIGAGGGGACFDHFGSGGSHAVSFRMMVATSEAGVRLVAGTLRTDTSTFGEVRQATPSAYLAWKADQLFLVVSVKFWRNWRMENRSAFCRMATGSQSRFSNRSTAARMDLVVCSAKWIPVLPLMTDSVTPPLPKQMTGVPQAWASTGTMPKSSSAAKTNARARWR